MQASAAIVPIVLPVLFWAGYHYHKDRALPEPPGHLLTAFLLGVAAAGLSRALYAGIGLIGLRFDAGYLADTSSLGLLGYAVLAIGPIEEFAKLLPFLLVVLRFARFDETIDGIIYASFIALGYAAVENWLYLDYLSTWEAAARGFASPVVHMLFASVWGHAVAHARVRGRSLAAAALRGFLAAAALHGLYDFAVLLKPGSALPIAALLILALWIWRLRVLRAMHLAADRDTQARL